ncbi:MAG: hypothetical protein ABH871_07225 [Pseudomonadota bacterium]
MRICRVLLLILTCIFILLITQSANAKKAKEPAETTPVAEESSESEKQDDNWVLMGDRFGPSWDERENYSDRYINEFTIVGGDYLGENWKNTYYVGGQYLFHLNQMFAFGGQYKYSPIVVDKNTPFYASLRTDAVHIATALCQLSTPAAWRIGKKMYNMDFYFTLGAGAMQINQQWEATGVIGGGVRMYFPVPWIAFRLDIDSYIHMTPLGNRNDLSGDVSMGGGVSFLFPNRKQGYYEKDNR